MCRLKFALACILCAGLFAQSPKYGLGRTPTPEEIRAMDITPAPDGTGLPEGKKSLAITIVLQPQERTLTDAEIEGFSQRLIAQVEKATGGQLRGG